MTKLFKENVEIMPSEYIDGNINMINLFKEKEIDSTLLQEKNTDFFYNETLKIHILCLSKNLQESKVVIETNDENNKFLNDYFVNTEYDECIIATNNHYQFDIRINLDKFKNNVKHLNLFVENTINMDNFIIKISNEDNENMIRYNYENIKQPSTYLKLGEFYKYDKGWRFFPTFEYII